MRESCSCCPLLVAGRPTYDESVRFKTGYVEKEPPTGQINGRGGNDRKDRVLQTHDLAQLGVVAGAGCIGHFNGVVHGLSTIVPATSRQARVQKGSRPAILALRPRGRRRQI